jgi:uncharacterized membrane protein
MGGKMTNRWIGLGMIAIATVFGIAVMNELPERVPIHWNISGQIDGYADRAVAVWLTPVVLAGLWLLLTFIAKLDPINKNYASMSGTVKRINNAVMLFLCSGQVVLLASALAHKHATCISDWNGAAICHSGQRVGTAAT